MRRARTAAWLLTPLSWCCAAVGCVAAVAAGPLALLLLPVLVPPLVLVLLQARCGTRLLRGDVGAARPLRRTAGTVAVLLLAGALVGLPGPTTRPPPLADVPTDVRAGVAALAALAAVHALAVGLLAPAASGGGRRTDPARLVGLALAGLAVTQVVAVTLGLPGG